MPVVDLFGNVTLDKSWEQKYKEYLKSAKWKKKCTLKLEQVGYKCERCGISKWAGLSVHHKTYEHFMDEPLEDLKVVCKKCHKIEDLIRQQETEAKNYQKLQDARFCGWARVVFGDDWIMNGEDYVFQKYQEWLDRKGEW
jgi:hypothetical protein